MKYIDKEEKEMIESYNKGEWQSARKKNKKVFIDAAKASITKSKRINIRLTSKDFYDIQAKAMEEGIPYQTLISSIIHKYNKGKIKPVNP
jgi:predicted DNA binding CopG/RHH family protein